MRAGALAPLILLALVSGAGARLPLDPIPQCLESGVPIIGPGGGLLTYAPSSGQVVRARQVTCLGMGRDGLSLFR